MTDKEAQEKIIHILDTFRELSNEAAQSPYHRKYFIKEITRVYEELGYRKPPDRPEFEEELRTKIVTLATGMMIVAGKLKVEDLDEVDKTRFEEICQLTYDQLIALYLPQDKPPVLSDEEIYKAYLGKSDMNNRVAEIMAEDVVQDSDRRIAQAQWEADIEWYDKS